MPEICTVSRQDALTEPVRPESCFLRSASLGQTRTELTHCDSLPTLRCRHLNP